MGADVFDENGLEAERLVAVLATVGLLGGVHAHMPAQIVGEAEGAAADTAQVVGRARRVLPVLVRSQLRTQHERPAAFLAQVRSRRRVLHLLVALNPALFDHLVANVALHHRDCCGINKITSQNTDVIEMRISHTREIGFQRIGLVIAWNPKR